MKDPEALAATMNKLDYLKKTLQSNPEAVLSNSFLNCTLSLSNDKSLPRKLKPDVSSSGSISFELTKHSNPGDFKKEKKKEEKEKEKKEEKVKEGKMEKKEEEDGDYAMEFEEYSENVEMNERREA